MATPHAVTGALWTGITNAVCSWRFSLSGQEATSSLNVAMAMMSKKSRSRTSSPAIQLESLIVKACVDIPIDLQSVRLDNEVAKIHLNLR